MREKRLRSSSRWDRSWEVGLLLEEEEEEEEEERLWAGMSVCWRARLGSETFRPGGIRITQRKSSLTLSHVQSDGVAGGVRRGAGVVPGVLRPGLVDGEGGDGGVGGRHPQRLPALLPHQVGGDAHPGGEVDHGLIVVPGRISKLDGLRGLCFRSPEHKLRGARIVSQLAGDLH